MAEDKDIAEMTEVADYDSQEEPEQPQVDKKEAEQKKDTHVAMHSSGWKEFLLKPELLRAIFDCGFEHPSEGNH